MSANSARGKGRLTEKRVLPYVVYAVQMGLFWGWAVLRAVPVGAVVGLLACIFFGDTAAWAIAIVCGALATPLFAGWTLLQGDDDVMLPVDSGLTLRRDGLRVDVTVEIWHSGIAIDDSPINAWIVESVRRRGGDRVDMIVSSKRRRTTLTIHTKKEEIVAHLERLAASGGRLG